MGHLYHGYVSHNQRVDLFRSTKFWSQKKKSTLGSPRATITQGSTVIEAQGCPGHGARTYDTRMLPIQWLVLDGGAVSPPWFVFIAIPATTHPHVELMWNLKKRQVKNVEHVLHQALSQQDMRLSNKNQDWHQDLTGPGLCVASLNSQWYPK